MQRIASGILTAVTVLIAAGAQAAEITPNTYGESLVRQLAKANPQVTSIVLHAVPLKAKDSVVVAATDTAQLGARSGTDVLAAAGGDSTTSAADAAGTHLNVLLPLRDVSSDRIGVLGVQYPLEASTDRAALLRDAGRLRDWLHRRISHVGNLLDPFPYDPDAPLDTYAQKLADEVIAKHPDVEIFAIHATPPDSDYNIIAASNIGRIGKKGDNDDMRCVFTGRPNLEVNSTGKRFETEMQLHDRTGKVIGAVSVVFGYKAGDDKEALHARGEKIRAEVERGIPDSDSLFRPAPPLMLRGRTELPGYTGDFDHFAADLPGNRLFLAAEDHGTLEVFNLRTGTHLKTVTGFENPHSIFLIPQRHRILVTDGSETIKLLDDASLAVVGTLALHPGADSIGYDAGSGHLYVVTGGKDVKMHESWLEEIDPVAAQKIGEVHFDADHVEAMAVEQNGPRLYINLTDKNSIAVVDKAKRSVVAVWPFHEAEQNALVQLDETTHRLFVVARKPGKMVMLNAADGASIASFTAPGHVDGEIFDSATRRVYAPGGEGYIGVYQEMDADRLAEVAHVPSAAGAKTALLVPELNRLYVAVSPGEGKTGGAIIWFDVD